MQYKYTILVNSKTVYRTNDYTDALEEYYKHCTKHVIVVQLLDENNKTIAEWRP